ncbi:unnamed protein product [Echinostoma caproni]|uniref:Uncharacterized protein n=1 Tax=Echinostoma caproni TaxID=27848 RepID=A0A183AXX3_9TREM|nr:unnamed protein product [Echinostoma caproni]
MLFSSTVGSLVLNTPDFQAGSPMSKEKKGGVSMSSSLSSKVRSRMGFILWPRECVTRACDYVWSLTSEANDTPELVNEQSPVSTGKLDDTVNLNVPSENARQTKIWPTDLFPVPTIQFSKRHIPWPGNYISKACDYVWSLTSEEDAVEGDNGIHINTEYSETATTTEVTPKPQLGDSNRSESIPSGDGVVRRFLPTRIPVISRLHAPNTYISWSGGYVSRACDYIWSFAHETDSKGAVMDQCSERLTMQEQGTESKIVTDEGQVKQYSQPDLTLVSKCHSDEWSVPWPGNYIAKACDYMWPFGNDTNENPDIQLDTDVNESKEWIRESDPNVAFLAYFSIAFLFAFPLMFSVTFLILFLSSFGVVFLITFIFSFLFALVSASVISMALPMHQIPPALLAYLHPQFWLNSLWHLTHQISLGSILSTGTRWCPTVVWNILFTSRP